MHGLSTNTKGQVTLALIAIRHPFTACAKRKWLTLQQQPQFRRPQFFHLLGWQNGGLAPLRLA